MAGGYQTWPLIQFGVIGEAWRLYKRHWVVWSLAMLIVIACYGFVTGALLSLLGVRHLEGPGGFQLFLMPGRHTLPFLVSNVVSSFFLGGMIRMASNQLRGRPPPARRSVFGHRRLVRPDAGRVPLRCCRFTRLHALRHSGLHHLRALHAGDSPGCQGADAGHRCAHRRAGMHSSRNGSLLRFLTFS